MTDDDLTELRRLHEAATAAPWAWEATGDKDNSWGIGVVEDADGNLIVGHNETGENGVIEPVCEAIDGNHADTALIVAMRNALPGLLTEVERLRAAPQVDAGAFERFARTADPVAMAELIEKATGARVESVSTERAAGSPPPTPAITRERLIEAIATAKVDDIGDVDEVSAWLDPDAIGSIADAVMALLSAEPAPPLWTGETERIPTEYGDDVYTAHSLIPVPPGTAVEVRATNPQPTDHT